MIENQKAPHRVRAAIVNILLVVMLLLFAACPLFVLLPPVNTLAYFAGYGDTVQVQVTKSSSGSTGFGKGDHGIGRIVGDGREVWLFGVREGETVSARTQLIRLSMKPTVYPTSAQALYDLLWLLCVPAWIVVYALYKAWKMRAGRKPLQKT
ncbi:hypothetical protein [Nocardia sp. NPDC050710]|uniref:hypothetical protein n=1 Tax=Nocardia sp. NPDC050710 TaxID=3157220 RepID=UPI0033FC07CD